MRKKFISLLTLIIFVATMVGTSVYADERSELVEKKNEAQNELNEIKSEKSSAQQAAEEATAAVESVQTEIDKLTTEINELNDSISQKEKEIEEKEKELQDRINQLKKRLIAMYVEGETSYLDFLLGSSSYIDMLANYDALQQITEADGKLIDKVTSEKEEIENAKKELEEKKEKVSQAKTEQEAKQKELKTAQAEKESLVASLTEEEKKQQAVVDNFNAQIRAVDAQIQAAAKAAAAAAAKKSGSSSSSSSSWVDTSTSLAWPLPSRYRSYSYITSYFGKRKQPTAGASTNHGAIDIGISSGTPVYAAESGRVIIAQWYGGYGKFIMIWHYNRGALYTAYGHLSSIQVSTGQEVSRGQQIALSGNTGVSTGPHLHFEVRAGGSASWNRVDPLSYVGL